MSEAWRIVCIRPGCDLLLLENERGIRLEGYKRDGVENADHSDKIVHTEPSSWMRGRYFPTAEELVAAFKREVGE